MPKQFYCSYPFNMVTFSHCLSTCLFVYFQNAPQVCMELTARPYVDVPTTPTFVTLVMVLVCAHQDTHHDTVTNVRCPLSNIITISNLPLDGTDCRLWFWGTFLLKLILCALLNTRPEPLVFIYSLFTRDIWRKMCICMRMWSRRNVRSWTGMYK